MSKYVLEEVKIAWKSNGFFFSCIYMVFSELGFFNTLSDSRMNMDGGRFSRMRGSFGVAAVAFEA